MSIKFRLNGLVRGLDVFNGKRYGTRDAKRSKRYSKNARVRYGTLRYVTVRYGTLRYATVRYGVKFGRPTVEMIQKVATKTLANLGWIFISSNLIHFNKF